jgi:hypothetical protein
MSSSPCSYDRWFSAGSGLTKGSDGGGSLSWSDTVAESGELQSVREPESSIGDPALTQAHEPFRRFAVKWGEPPWVVGDS